MKNDESTTQEKAAGCEASVVERLVMWLNEWYRVRNLKRLKKRLWKANEIILMESHGYNKRENKPFKKELAECSDAIETCIVKVCGSYDT